MRNTKILSVILGIGCFVAVAIYIFMQPSYSVQTDGVLYAVNKASSDVTVFDLHNGKQIKEIPIAQEPHEAAVLEGASKIVITNYGSVEDAGKSITVIDGKDNTVDKVIDLGESLRPHGIIALEDSNKIAVVTDIGNDLLVVDINESVVNKEIETKQDFSHLLVKHPSKQLCYVANIKSGSVSVIDIENNEVIKVIKCGEKAEGIDITPDGQELWVTNIKENYISIIKTESLEIMERLHTGKEPLRLKFSVDGKLCLVSNSGDGTISIYDTRLKKQVANIIIPGKKNIFEKVIYRTPRPVGILIHPNGKYAYVSNMTAGRVEVINMNSFEIVSSIKVGDMPDGLAILN
ncbi:MAG: beta-propeller fold lactonase family protein [Jejuia sp.]